MASEIGKKRKTDGAENEDGKTQELREMRSDYEKRGMILRGVVVDLAKAERVVARNLLHQKSSRFGHFTMKRDGEEIHEFWEEGQELKDLNARLEPIQQDVKKIAETKKNLQRQLRHANVGRSDGEISAQRQNLDILQFREANVKRDLLNIRDQKRVHEKEKTVYKQEAKRIAREDASPFREFPEYQEGRYVLLNLLGKGGFGEVFKAFDMEKNQYVACKLHLLGHLSRQVKNNILKHMDREWNVHKTLIHPHIIRHLDNFNIDDNTFCSVLELCSGKDLAFVLKSVGKFPEDDAKVLISQILHGLAYLSEREEKIIHYDLKPANVLLADDGIAKISDFGLCKVMVVGSEDLELTSPGAGTIWYLPPECLVEGVNHRISTKVDVWSAGVVFYELLFGRVPFGIGHRKSRDVIRQEIIGNVLHFPSTPEISLQAKAFIQNCLTFDPALRPNAGTLAQDPYLRPARQNV